MSGQLAATVVAVAASLGLLYAVVAVGFTVSYQLLGEANLAFGDAIALSLVLASVVFGATHSIGAAVACSVAVTTVVLVVLDRLILSPLRSGVDRLAPIVATIGAALILRNVALSPFGADDRSFPPVFGSGALVVGTTAVDATVLGAAVLLVTVGIAAAGFGRRTWGRALIALRDDPVGAQLVGIPVRRLASLIYAVGGALGAAGGLLLAAHVRSVGAGVGFRLTVVAFSAAIIGGGSLRGAAVGGLVLGTVAAVAQVIIGSTSADAISLGLLIAVVLIRPHGLSREPVTVRV